MDVIRSCTDNNIIVLKTWYNTEIITSTLIDLICIKDHFAKKQDETAYYMSLALKSLGKKCKSFYITLKIIWSDFKVLGKDLSYKLNSSSGSAANLML